MGNRKNYTLISFNFLQEMRNLFDEVQDKDIKQKALDLIEKEDEPKYKKKYATVWKNT